MGLQGKVCVPGSAGVPARNAALARGDTLILAFSHEGRRDPLAVRGAWFRVEILAASDWIPAFAGMTGGEEAGMTGGDGRKGAYFVRIRIYGIIGFSGFYGRVSATLQAACPH